MAKKVKPSKDDQYPKISIPRGVVRLVAHNSKNLVHQAKRKIKGDK